MRSLFLAVICSISRALTALLRLVYRAIGPKIGQLHQHAPRKLYLPPHYTETQIPAEAPRISIVTPSFNQAEFVEQTIQSVLNQAYPNMEYRIQDGGSDDGSREIISSYAHSLAGWESCQDSGQSQAINLGFARTTGEIMAWLNSDDMLLPGALAYVAAYFVSHPEVDVVYGHRILIDEKGRQIGRWMLPAHSDEVLSWVDYIPQETLFWRRSIWEKVGGQLDESFRFAMDWDLLLRFRSVGGHFARLPRFLAAFRVHPHQKTSTVMSDVGVEEMCRIHRRVLGRPASVFERIMAVSPYLLRQMGTDWAWRIRRILGIE